MNKTTIGILATAALLFTPVAAFADHHEVGDSQNSSQISGNSAAAIGKNNDIDQYSQQYSDQMQVDGYGYDYPDSQGSIQGQFNEGATVGEYNELDQYGDQTNMQTQID